MTSGPAIVPELLAPAGTLRNLRYALAYGADAVYAGIPRYSLRVRNNEFGTLDALAEGIAAVRTAGKRFYLAANLMPHGAKLATFIADLEPVIALAPDALIMSDPGLILLVRERWPEVAIHLSVQANTTNAAAVRFWQRQGIRRVIVSRELSLDEIAEIRQACPDMELEVFVHGALCIAYSGRCLLSGYLNHRDANQGSCTNACRWSYRVGQAVASSSATPSGAHEREKEDDNEHANAKMDGTMRAAPGAMSPTERLATASRAEELLPGLAALGPTPTPERHPEADQAWLLEEAERPGEYMALFEDEHGSYVMNSRDLRAVEHVARLSAIGVDSLKIEGRTKSHYYTARTTSVYRRAIDDAAAGRGFDRALLDELEGLANRGYTEGFLRRHAPSELQNYEAGSSVSQLRQFVGELVRVDAASGLAEIRVRNRFVLGDELEWITPTGLQRFRLEQLSATDGRPLEAAPGDGWTVRIRMPKQPLAPESLLAKVI
ncbi:tRNA 5-hydroxyuridine modification protein YegQ [Lamprobacter modestohalophilus]|uniref:prephenate-dependent tRNA uridine(34) hydroxylase TrhP n=1 Tax=Lamprobacter modestohalophilus TaxID=1064514 RepID=UPI002ADEE8A9|nr:tRNA 5-hydroxyuridine modification protein YegQ [Lamprobacter modestohalophilus]MEA1049978.1 tRNA 5-hydroxyuridine modification protein YegQ [Lamprobacter modestohalophilus]